MTPLLATAYLGLRGRWRAAAGVAVATLATFGVVTAFRLAYYGWPLPNTYYAKVDLPLGVRLAGGARQLVGTGGFTGLMFYVLVVLAALLLGLSRRRLSALPFPAFFVAGWMAYYVWVGGDVFLERFLLFIFPMGAFLLIEWLEKAHPRLLPAAVGLLLILQLGPMATDPRFAYRASKYDRWVTLGRYLGREHPGTVVAVDGAGKIPFFSDLRAIDMLGLTDAHIGHGEMAKRDFFWVGHAKSDPAYVLSRRPDLVASWIPEVGWLYEGPAPKPEALAAAGYHLIYLVNTDEWPKQPNVVNVRDAGPSEILRQLNHGYRYGVYGRGQR